MNYNPEANTTSSISRNTAAPASTARLLTYVSTYATVLVLLCLSTHGVFSFLGISADSSEKQDYGVTRYVMAIGWGAGILLIWRRARMLARGFQRSKLVFCIPLLAIASAWWSQDAKATLLGAAFLLLTTVFALYFAQRYHPAEQMRIVMIAGGIATISGLMLAMLFPRYGLDSYADAGALQGIFVGKNVCALETIFFLTPAFVVRPHSPLTRLARIGYIVLLVGALVATRSKTGLVVLVLCFAGFGFSYLLRPLNRRAKLLTVATVVCFATVLGVFVSVNADSLFNLLGKDATLTGRTKIWGLLAISIMKRPLLGYGYGGFWLGLRGESSNVISGMKWIFGYAHNGALEVILQLGVVGLALVLILLGRTSWYALVWRKSRRPAYINWYIGLVALTWVYNLDEAFLAAYNSLPWMLFLVATLTIGTVRKRPPERAFTAQSAAGLGFAPSQLASVRW